MSPPNKLIKKVLLSERERDNLFKNYLIHCNKIKKRTGCIRF